MGVEGVGWLWLAWRVGVDGQCSRLSYYGFDTVRFLLSLVVCGWMMAMKISVLQ